MIWDRNGEKWEEYFREAQRYYLEHGELEVPVKYVTENGVPLGRWLAEIGSQFGEKNACRTVRQWNEKYALAKNYYEEYGNLNVPVSYSVNGVKLGRWISNIRAKRKHPEGSGMVLDEHRIRQLDSIGMDWK